MNSPERSDAVTASAGDSSIDKFNLVQQYFENSGIACWECEHFANWTEPHGERMSECRLLEEGKPELCPALDELIEQAKKDAEENT